MVMKCDSEDLVAMFQGKLSPTMAFMSGKLKITGNMGAAMKLEKLMGQVKVKLWEDTAVLCYLYSSCQFVAQFYSSLILLMLFV